MSWLKDLTTELVAALVLCTSLLLTRIFFYLLNVTAAIVLLSNLNVFTPLSPSLKAYLFIGMELQIANMAVCLVSLIVLQWTRFMRDLDFSFDSL